MAAPSSGSFSHFQIVVTDSGWLLEPQEFTVPGNQSHLDILGLITGIGYEVRLTGFSESGLLSRPLTTVAVTGTTQCTARTLTAPLSTQSNFVETAANFMIQF
uniref:Fibronectin type-III domain-containing protein n=1 Tax=Mola mola TaxID=94237 RepID=A0A3Q4B100_MOLML